MRSPTISAVVPAYNCERYVGETLTAVLSQTRPPDEVIVVDDGSTDGTLEALAPFRSDIRLVKQRNLGVAGAFNRCFEESRCEYVAKCDSDDIWAPHKLEQQAAALLVHPEIDIAICAAQLFGTAEGPRLPYPEAGLLDPGHLAARLYRSNFVCNSGTMIRRSLFQRLGPFTEGHACEDYDYWLRALQQEATFFYDADPLVRYRMHAEQISNSLLRMHKGEYETHLLHAGLVQDRGLVNSVLARDLARIGRQLAAERRPREARAAFASSLRRRPTPRSLAWIATLSVPGRYRDRLVNRLASIKRAVASTFRQMNSRYASP